MFGERTWWIVGIVAVGFIFFFWGKSAGKTEATKTTSTTTTTTGGAGKTY